MTFHAYGRARQMGLALKDVRERPRPALGRPGPGLRVARRLPRGVRQGSSASPRARPATPGSCLFARRVETPLGPMLALADDDGLHALDFLDRKGLARKVDAIRAARGLAALPGDHPHLDAVAEQLDAYFAGRSLAFDLPTVPLGSPWQRPSGTSSGRSPRARRGRMPGWPSPSADPGRAGPSATPTASTTSAW